jgi:endonuclease-3
LMEVIPPERWTMACHQLVFHGREVCMAKNPQCPTCPVAKLCPKIGVSLKK